MATPLAPGFGFSGQARHRMSYEQVKRLAQAFGLPGDAIAQIAKGESSLYADIQQRDPGDGMVGYGLLQMTPNSWGGKNTPAYRYMQHLGGIRAMKDPVKNMAMARFLYKAAGNKLTPWYGTKFLTNRSGEGKLGPIDHTKVNSSLARAVTSGAQRSSGTPGTSTTRTVTTTTPGVDNRLARASLIQSFLDSHSSLDPLDFALQARQLQDVAPTSTTRTTRSSTPGTPGTSGHAPGHGRISAQGAGSSFAKSHSPLLELIHKTNSGPGYAVKNGKVVSGPQVFGGVWDGHADHVHVAAGPKTVVEIGRMAQKLGLHVGENPHFGGVNPVHVPGSYHYKGEAIDVSGDPGRMNHFAAEVKRLYGLG